MARAQPSQEENEDDFEYEYSDDSEDFYFTLDVTTHASPAAANFNETTPNRNAKGKQAAQTTQQQLEVLDLHSDNPLVKLGDSFYSCRWSTDFGTQFYVAKAGILEDSLRPGHVLDVVGTSHARLTGKPVTLHRRDAKTPTQKPIGSSSTNAIVLDDTEDQTLEQATPEESTAPLHPPSNKNIKRLAAARSKARDPNVKAQASFLERLAIIKQRKGEKDVVPIHGLEGLTGSDRDTQNAIADINSDTRRTITSVDDETNAGSEPVISTSEQRSSVAAGTDDTLDHIDRLSSFGSTSGSASQQNSTINDATVRGSDPPPSQQDTEMG